MKSNATTVEQYLRELPKERQGTIRVIRDVILGNLPAGFEECMSYGMIGYVVPHRLYPPGYHCDPMLPLPLANLGSQKNYMALYLMTVYGDAAIGQWFREAWLAAGKKLDMGKCCVRFKSLEEVPLEVVGKAIARFSVKEYIAHVEKVIGHDSGKPASRRK